MSERRTVYKNADGVRRTSIFDENDPAFFRINTEQDVEPVLDSIHRDRELMAQTGDMKLSHRIPTIIYEQLQAQGIADDPDLFKAWLNSSEADPWRIWPGRL